MILPSPYETTNFERILSNTCFSGPKKRASQGLTVPNSTSSALFKGPLVIEYFEYYD